MSEVEAYLASLQPLSWRLGLGRVERALEALGHPERALRILHVAGTNGKGSTCAMAAQALREAGYRVGLYTSPHLVRFNERIAIDGVPLTDDVLMRLIGVIRGACRWHETGTESERLTYFEFATLLALLAFAEAQVGAVVLEVGLGGRFDATNVVHPLACAVARIGLDHTEILGDSLGAIAREKAGIFKPGVPVAVSGGQPEEALAALRAEAERRNSPLVVAPGEYLGPVALAGPHQRENAALAATALQLLNEAGLCVSSEAIARGIAQARWPGRLEEVGGVLLDGAHNPDGAGALARSVIALYPGRRIELVFGVLADKDHRGMLQVLSPAIRSIHLVEPRTPRARELESYVELARGLFARVDRHASLREAISCARTAAVPDGVVCVAGSLYLVGEARRLLLGA